jgi:LEA14-like dessication related protein
MEFVVSHIAKISFLYLCENKKADMRYKSLRNILLLLSILLLIGGCQNYKKLQFQSYAIEKIDNISFGKGSVSATLTLNVGVANPTSTTFTAKDLEATIYSGNGDPFAILTSDEKMVIPPNSEDSLKWKIDTELLNPLSVLAAGGFSMENLDVENMTVDYSIVFSGGIRKRFSGKGVVLGDLIRAFKSTLPDSQSQ